MKLKDDHNRNIFKVPEGYFEELPGKIQRKIQANNDKPAFFQVSAFRWLGPVAATIIILLMILYPTSQEGNQVSAIELLEEIETEALVSYLEFTDMSSEEILSELNSTTIEELELQEKNTLLDEDLSEEELELLYEEYFEDV